ncbi:MAG TPA: dihydrofolate reductase family protein [Pyrinomonadaceae bacterium]|nr:dihydrofolate reductase family protein [Pyrinomonadaceae bacterium]
MRKVTLGLANSLDNFIARQDGGSDWLHWSSEVAEISAAFMKTVDVLVMGRKTYEVMLAAGETSYPGATNYVFTRSAKKAAALRKRAGKKTNLKIVSDDAAAFIGQLKSTSGKDIVVFGGGELASILFNADLIDEVVLNVHPVILGSGVPLFSKIERQINLELFKVKRLKNSCIMLSYRVQR